LKFHYFFVKNKSIVQHSFQVHWMFFGKCLSRTKKCQMQLKILSLHLWILSFEFHLLTKKFVIKWRLFPPSMFEIVLKFFTSFTRCLGKSLWIPYSIIQKCKVNQMGNCITKNTALYKATIEHCPTSIMPSPACFPKCKELPHIMFLNVFLGIPINGYHKGKLGLMKMECPLEQNFPFLKF
jgi:hypothetical protein